MKRMLFALVFLGLFVFSAWAKGEQDKGPRVTHPPLEAPRDASPSPGTFRDLVPINPEARGSLGSKVEDWYKDGAFYHIWINAFKDSNGDGIGDIPGIIQELDYLKNLGITGIWLSPFFESRSTEINLHMYDTVDHYKVDPRFGTNDDIQRLLREAHARGIRVIFDWVPNHVSSDHPWFQKSGDGDEEYEDWFVWRDEPGSEYGPWGQSVWHSHSNGRYYYGVFWSGMPDLNFRHQGAKDAITNVAIHWLNQGFDGVRVDAVRYLYEDERSVFASYDEQKETLEYFQAFRSQVLDAFGKITDPSGRGYHKMMVAENWTSSQDSLESYMVSRNKPGFHMTFDFPLAYILGERLAGRINTHWQWVTQELDSRAWMATFLSNHDNVVNRPITVYGEELVRPITAAQILGPGTPFVYYGNEIGMPDASQFAGASHADRRHRQPFLWDQVQEQKQDPKSILNFHRDILSLRADRVSLRRGDYQVISTGGRTLIFSRSYQGEKTLVLINLSTVARELEQEIPQGTGPSQILFQEGDNNVLFEEGRLLGQLGPGGVLVLSY